MTATGCETFSLADFTLKQTTFEPFHEDTQFSASDENPLVAYKVRVNFEGNLPLPESECKWTHVGFCYDRPYVEWIHGSFTGNFSADGAPIVTVEWAAAGPLSSTNYDLWRNGKYEIYDISGNSITFAIGGHPDSIDVTHEFGVRAVNLLDGCLSDLVTCTVTVPGDLTECPPEAGEILIKTNIVGPEYNANGDLVGIQIQLVWSGETGSYIKILRSFEGCDGNFSEIGSVSVTQNYFYSTLQSGQIATYKVVSGRNNCNLVGESDCYTINVTPLTGLNEGTVYFYVKDHLGNTRLVLDRDGYIQSRMDYEPYGIELYPLAANTSGEKYKFTNQERDYTTGLDYFHARYYSSAMGRFMGADSVMGNPENAQSWNKYAYTKNNPINRIDINGQWDKPTHRNIIDNALPGKLTPDQRKSLHKGSNDTDDLKNQGIHSAYKHGQKKITQSAEQGKAVIDKYISDTITQIKGIQGATPKTLSEIKPEALYLFGKLAHTLSDQASPQHTDEKGNPTSWLGLTDPIGLGAAAIHFVNEPSVPTQEQDKKMEGDIQELWKKAFGEITLTKIAPSTSDEKPKSEKDAVK